MEKAEVGERELILKDIGKRLHRKKITNKRAHQQIGIIHLRKG